MRFDADDLEQARHRGRRIQDHDGSVAILPPRQLEDRARAAAVQERELAEIEDDLAGVLANCFGQPRSGRDVELTDDLQAVSAARSRDPELRHPRPSSIVWYRDDS